jgi:hypothetical protein
MLRMTPGWGAQAAHRLKELEADPSGIFIGITEAVRSRIASLSEAPKSGESEQ